MELLGKIRRMHVRDKMPDRAHGFPNTAPGCLA